MTIDTSSVDPDAAVILQDMETRLVALETGEITINIPQVSEIQYTFTDGTVRKFIPDPNNP